MATVFMKWLETSPKDYERGIRILTLGKLKKLREYIIRRYVHPGDHVLEIGCGTGLLAVEMAKKGALVDGIDISAAMLAVTEKKIPNELIGSLTLTRMDATQVGDHFPAQSFDLIVSTLVFSELSPNQQRDVLRACRALLAPEGRLLLADEMIPANRLVRIVFYLVRYPLTFLTWLLTRTTTSTLKDIEVLLEQMGFEAKPIVSYLGGSLVLYEANLTALARRNILAEKEGVVTTRLPGLDQPVPGWAQRETKRPAAVVGQLRHRITLRTLLIDLWGLFFRIIPPYPRFRPGLYRVGYPSADSPVLVTGNFDLTVRRLVRVLDGRVDAWLLVADSAGINVWCAAGGGYLTAEKIIAVVKSSQLDEVVRHRALILPQLCANGVDGWKVREETGRGIHWGPVRAEDIPDYLAVHRKKTDRMRWVRFPLLDRLEMVTVTLGFYGILILLPMLIFWRSLFWPAAASLIGLSYFYAIFHPWLPGRDGLLKSIPLTLIALAGLVAYTALWNPLPAPRMFNWAVGMTGLSVFTAAELQGMSPLMRGEQANWTWELATGVILGLIFWLTPLAMGWR